MLRICSVLIGLCALVIGGAVSAARISAGNSAKDTGAMAWLIDGQCALPCWRGINPGTTSFEDAERLLRVMPDVDQGRMGTQIGDQFRTTWFEITTPRGRLRGEVSSGGGNPIQYLWFYALHGGTALRLSDVVALLGPPERVDADSGSYSRSLLHFAYPSHQVEALVFDSARQRALTPCNRLQTAVGIYLGARAVEGQAAFWYGFTRYFDRLCS